MRTTHWVFAAARSEVLVSENRGRAKIRRLWGKKSVSNTQVSLSIPYPIPARTQCIYYFILMVMLIAIYLIHLK